METILIFARCFILREQNWTQAGWFLISPLDSSSDERTALVEVEEPTAFTKLAHCERFVNSSADHEVSMSVFNCTFKHFVNHQLKFLLNNYNYSGITIEQQMTKQKIIELFCHTVVKYKVSKIFCHQSLIEEITKLMDNCEYIVDVIPCPPVDRVYISQSCTSLPNHNNISCVRCILFNLYGKLFNVNNTTPPPSSSYNVSKKNHFNLSSETMNTEEIY